MLADHAARAAADELGGRERVVHALERRLGRRQVRAGREHDREVAVAAAQRVARGRGRLGGAEARVRLRREPAADAYAHALRTILAAPPRDRRAILAAVPALPIVALFGPTGVGKTDVAIALAELLRADGEDPVAVSADALQLYAGLEILTGAATAEQRARLEHRLLGDPPAHRARDRRRLRPPRARRDRRARRRRAPADRRRRHRAVPARRARRARPPPAARPRCPRALRRAASRARARPRCTPSSPPATRRPRPPIAPTDTQRVVRALELLDAGDEPPGGDQLWTADTRHPTLLVALTMERDALYARIDARVDAMVAAGAAEEVAARGRRRRLAVRPPGARLRGAAARRRRGDAAPHPPLRQAPAHMAAQAAGHAERST